MEPRKSVISVLINHHRAPLTVLIIVGLAYVFTFYGNVILSPNDYMFSQDGDGLKNYFTYAYHIKHGASFTNLEGVNYPYSEHSLYTDSHPVISYIFKALANWSALFSEYSIGILNLFLIGGMFITFLVLYKLLVELGVKHWLAVAFAIGIFLMAPQMPRISGHFALSYSCAIPLTWWLFLRQWRSPSFSNIVLLFLNNLLWLFIHAYLGMIALSFLFMLVVFQWWFNAKTVKKGLVLLATVCLPILFFYVFAKVTDTHLDRTNNPSGYFLYYAEFDNIILPSYGPLRPIWDVLTFGIINLKGEGNAYIGFINVLFMAFITFLAISSIFIKKKRETLITYFKNRNLNSALLASFVVLWEFHFSIFRIY